MKGKYLVQQMALESRKANSGKICPRSHSYVLDVFSMDPKVHPGKILENLLKIYLDKKEGTKSPSMGKMGPNC